nr:regulatory protein SoxS [Salmonella sp. NCTC 7297]
MSHQQIIQTLIEWIDEHIDQPLNIDVVAKKSVTPSGICSGCSVR